MSDPSQVNPYQAPAASGLGDGREHAEGSSRLVSGVTPPTFDYLRQTQPWVRFFSILAFIWFATMAVVTLVLLLRTTADEELPSAILAAVYGIYGVVALPPAIFLGRYATSIARFRATWEPYHLEDAIRAQKSYWRFAGVTMLIGLAFCLLAMAVFIFGAGVWTKSSGPRGVRAVPK